MELLGQESSFPFFFLEVNESFLPVTLEMGGEPDAATNPPYGAKSGVVTKKSHRCRQKPGPAQYLYLKSTLS